MTTDDIKETILDILSDIAPEDVVGSIAGCRPLVAPPGGKTLEEALAAKLTADFDAKVPGAADTSARFITQMYSEMKAGK